MFKLLSIVFLFSAQQGFTVSDKNWIKIKWNYKVFADGTGSEIYGNKIIAPYLKFLLEESIDCESNN